MHSPPPSPVTPNESRTTSRPGTALPDVTAAGMDQAAPADASGTSGAELRAEDRQRVDQAPLGHITLQTRVSSQPVRLIRDISAHGVSLLLDEEVAPGEPVLIAQTLAPQDDELPSERTPAQTHAARAVRRSGVEPYGEHVYRAYVVWCRRQAADDMRPGPTFVAGLRVFDPHVLDHLVDAQGRP